MAPDIKIHDCKSNLLKPIKERNTRNLYYAELTVLYQNKVYNFLISFSLFDKPFFFSDISIILYYSGKPNFEKIFSLLPLENNAKYTIYCYHNTNKTQICTQYNISFYFEKFLYMNSFIGYRSFQKICGNILCALAGNTQQSSRSQ